MKIVDIQHWPPARFLHRHLLTLLVLAYVAATFWPQLGLRIRTPLGERSSTSLIHWMLAALLFTLGLSLPWSRVASLVQHTKWIGVSLAIRAVVCLIVIGLLHFLPAPWMAAAAGYVLLLAMPAAASSSGWCLQLGSSQSVSLALIVGTTLVSAVTAPWLLQLSSLLGPTSVENTFDALRTAYQLDFFLPWILVPTLLGITVRTVHAELAKLLHELGRAVNPLVLLLLNYANGSSSLPQLREQGSSENLVPVILGCILVFVVVSWSTYRTARRLGSNRSKCISTVLGTSMSNTGLGLVVATAALPAELGLHVAVIAYTFVQHLGVALMGRWMLLQTERVLDASPTESRTTRTSAKTLG